MTNRRGFLGWLGFGAVAAMVAPAALAEPPPYEEYEVVEPEPLKISVYIGEPVDPVAQVFRARRSLDGARWTVDDLAPLGSFAIKDLRGCFRAAPR